jgi:plasmid maintenance system antidote protein VapI
MKQPAAYTSEELVAMLKNRQGGQTQVQFAAELGISMQFLSQVLNGSRSVGNETILKYLAPPKKKFVHRDCWDLVDN